MSSTVSTVTTDEPEINVRFGVNVERVRTAQDLNQAELASEVGKTQQWLAKVENASIGVRLEDAAMIADALGVSLRTLLPEPRGTAYQRLTRRRALEVKLASSEKKVSELDAQARQVARMLRHEHVRIARINAELEALDTTEE
jgi:transcriptional regulator with XRE-family HTH domain